jgi:hypothetical protein
MALIHHYNQITSHRETLWYKEIQNMANFSKGVFRPKNPGKYIGVGQITYRSSWELKFMQFCDNSKNVIQWASESIKIPYTHPFTRKQTIYVPDFLVLYLNKYGKQVAELVEIKPKKQTVIEGRMSQDARAVVAVNHAKWNSAVIWCKRMGIRFRIITEAELFPQPAKRK